MAKKANVATEPTTSGSSNNASCEPPQDGPRSSRTVETNGELTEMHAEILARSADLDGPDHVQECRETLISSGIGPYRGLADDLLQMIPTARRLRPRVRKRDREAIAARLGWATWNEVRNRSLNELLAIDTSTWRASDRRHLEPLIRAHGTLQRYKDGSGVDRDEILESLRTVPHATGHLYRASVPAQTIVLYDALRAAGHIGRIAECCLRLERRLPSIRRLPAETGSLVKGFGRQATRSQLCRLLEEDSDGLSWGWGDPRDHYFKCEILFLDLPTGQISWPCSHRLSGPNFTGRWDGRHENEPRIVRWASQVLVGDTDTVSEGRENEAPSQTPA